MVPPPPPSSVTWIHVDKPTFDVMGIIVGSFQAAGVLLFTAMILGSVIGLTWIRIRRRNTATILDPVSLHLDREPRSPIPLA